ncbi:Transposon Ty3-I Gag-Pol polyprotein [Trichinella papuae]|uniref:Transposon Ty3-I Gag-Pol polyprotein n=1 Tax=Trichinella papuae TaxID=268474 RepID=A0A0V1MN87_9BILA|nr:Transposon Ty3-I Gag-Pol polyprotein [Trichinella papuae]
MLKQGIIKASNSPCMATEVYTLMKSGDLRICVDNREVNKKTRKDAYPLPLPDNIFDKVRGHAVFSTLEMQSRFSRIPVNVNDKEKTAFSAGQDFCASGVLTSKYGVVRQYLLSDSVCRELFLVGQARENFFEEQYAKEMAELGRRARVCERDLAAPLAGGVASREVYCAIQLQDPLTLTEARNLAEKVIKNVEVAEGDREKTTFSILGLFQFRVMPLDVCNAPTRIQRLMENALRKLTWKTCLVYLDDIIIFSRSEEEHLERLEGVLLRLRLVGLKVKPGSASLCARACHTWAI